VLPGSAIGEIPQEQPLHLRQRSELRRQLRPHRDLVAIRRETVQPGSGHTDALFEDGLLDIIERLALLGSDTSLHVHAGYLHQQGEMTEGGSEAARFGVHVSFGVHEAGLEDTLGIGGQLAPVGQASRGRSEAVELIEQARDGVTVGIELERLLGLVPEEQEANELRRQQLGHLVGCSAATVRRTHLAAAHVEELIGHVQWWLAIEDLATDGIAAITAAALGGKVLAATLDADVEMAPLGCPIDVERQLRAATEGCYASGVATAGGPRHVVRQTLVGHGRAVPVGGEGGADAAAVLADDRDRQPAGRPLDVADLEVDATHRLGPVEGLANEWVHRAVAVELTHPVDLGLDAQALERAHEELANEVARIARGITALGSRDMGQWHTHVAIDRVRGEQRLGVHGVQVVHAVKEAAGSVGLYESAVDGVMQHHSSERADVDGARWRL
jgi:hypothetical protein